MRGVFRISRGSRTTVDPVLVEIHEGDNTGRGESNPSSRYGETSADAVEAIKHIVPALEAGLDRKELTDILPPGGARNAVDCALWDLQAKKSRKPVWQLAGLDKPQALTTAFTLSIDDPEKMATTASTHASRPLLKLKLAGDGLDLARVTAVRQHAPDSELIVDANEAWSQNDYEILVPEFENLGVVMIEQPFKENSDALLADLDRPIPVCADESCHTSADLERLQGLYDMINIKLDKTGGLSEALNLRAQAMAGGFAVMVGCMLGTSLAMAPAMLIAQGACFVDLDGPLLLAEDRTPGLEYTGSIVQTAPAGLWG